MLTKQLLEVSKQKPNINPRYRDINEYQSVAEQVLDAYELGQTQGQIHDTVETLETHDTFKLVRGLSKLLDRRVEFEQQFPVDPSKLRDAVFTHGFVTTTNQRKELLATVGNKFDLTPNEVENNLRADRESHAVLRSEPQIGPRELLRQYNLSLTQTLLFDAVELEFAVSDNFQEIFRLISYLGLMYTVDQELNITVTGPTSLVKKTRKYGTTMAKLIPSVMKPAEWSITAQIETEVGGDPQLYEFNLDSADARYFPRTTVSNSFDSEVERDFATRIRALIDAWTVNHEPTILRTEDRVMIPDFSFERDTTEFYLEVVGFWTPEYLEEKLQKVHHVKSDYPMILAVNGSLNCTKSDFDEANVTDVFFYDDQIPVKPVMKRLHAINEREIRDDLGWLHDHDIQVNQNEIINIDSLAASHDVESKAVEKYLNDTYAGVVSKMKFIPSSTLSEIEAAIDTLDDMTLANVNPILKKHDIGQDVLEEIGYTVKYISLDQNEAKIIKSE
jgi:Uncharacterized conserved protein